MKPITFVGDSRDRLRDFPKEARSQAGVELFAVQTGREPSDWKPLKTVGTGVREIRIREASGAFRVVYLATFADRVLVLHAFQKKTQQTSRNLQPSDLNFGWRTPMEAETFESVFDALADTKADAANMKARAGLLLSIRDQVGSWDVSQDRAAARLGITRPRLNDLLRGKLSKFSLDALVNIASAANLEVEICVKEVA